ncbi:MAG: hypothetical protein OQK73_07455 [Gammaproteobacteria bacterium]|nr:hypothetical protein [Gammaproteobacteria bacterium]
MAQTSLTLFIPGLFEPGKFLSQYPEYTVPRLSALETFLARAKKINADPVDELMQLAQLFGLTELPVAALLHGLKDSACTRTSDDDWYMCADPVYIQPDRDSAVLLAHEQLQLSMDEARTIATKINQFYANEPWQLEVLQSQQWVIKSTQSYQLELKPLENVMGQYVFDYLPKGKDSGYWKSIFNEIQMLLHALPLNQQRQQEGKLPVNSLWFWGEGSLPARFSQSCEWSDVFGNSSLMKALSYFSECPFHSIETESTGLLKEILDKKNGPVLYVDQSFMNLLQDMDMSAWIEKLEMLDDVLVNFIIKSLKSGTISSVKLYAGDGCSYSLNMKRLRNWLKFKKPLW